jgi:hypothetical protein
MNFIKKIFQDRIDEQVHQQFVRFSKGIFTQKAIVNFKKGAAKIKVTTSFELANDLVQFVFELAEKARVSGILLSRQLVPGLGAGKKKKILFEYEINKEMTSNEINEIAKNAYSMLLDCSASGIELKMKKKLPKPGKGEGKVNDKFCVLEADLKYEPKIREEFLFDVKEPAKSVQIKNAYKIEDIILPKGEKDFEKIRILAKRKGKIIRKISIEGRETASEKAFIA